MPSMDIFEGDAFSTRELSAAIQMLPIQWGRIGQLGLFRDTPVRVPEIMIESYNGTLSLIQSTPRGTDGKPHSTGKRSMRPFRAPRFATERRITADEIDGIRAFGEETVLRHVAEKLREMRADVDITREYLRSGALSGIVKDADGTIIADLFSDFGVTQKVVDFVLGTASTDVTAKVREVRRHVELNLLGDTMTNVHALASKTWFDKFIGHAEVKEAYKFFTGVNPLRDDVCRAFSFQGITFEEYLGEASVPNEDGTSTMREFIAEGDVRFFPVGTQATFRGFNAPADYLDTVNTPGRPVYAAQARDQKFNRWIDLEAQTNYLPIAMRPAVLVRGHSSN